MNSIIKRAEAKRADAKMKYEISLKNGVFFLFPFSGYFIYSILMKRIDFRGVHISRASAPEAYWFFIGLFALIIVGSGAFVLHKILNKNKYV